MQDRRRTPRISLDVAVGFSTAHNFLAGRTRDISIGGLFIESNVGMDPGTPITVKLTLGRNTYVLDCTVAWVLDGDGRASAGFGVSFDRLPDRVRDMIQSFMDKRDPLAFEMEVEAEDDAAWERHRRRRPHGHDHPPVERHQSPPSPTKPARKPGPPPLPHPAPRPAKVPPSLPIK